MSDEPSGLEDRESAKEQRDLLHAVSSFWNLNLLRDANEDLKSIDSHVVSVTAFHIGVVTLASWSFVMLISFIFNQIVNSGDVLSMASIAFQLGPTVPFFLFLFAYVTRWSFRRLQESTPPNSDWSIRVRRFSLGVASVVSLVVAGVGRWGIFVALDQVYGDSMNSVQILAVMIIDVGYLALLLIGIGGLATLITEPESTVKEAES